MQKANQNKKIIKLMSGVLAILTISSPTSLATKPIQLEDKPGILEKFKSFAWTAAIIGGAIIITGAIIYGISKIKESRNIEEFKRNLDLALKDITNKADVEYMLNEIKEMLVPKVENNRINEFEIRFAEFKTRVQALDNINAAKMELLQGLHAIVKAFNVRFDTNEFNNLKSNKTGKNAEGSKHESNKPKLPDEFEVIKIAVIGSHIDGNKAMPHISRDGLNLNEFTVHTLCSCGLGKKLSEYNIADEDDNLKNNEIKLYENYPERLPKDSMLISRDGEWVVLSFYYLDNCNETETKMIIENCQYAICPFRAKSKEIEGDLNECKLKKRLTELRDFIRQYNKTCDVRFLYYIDNIKNTDDIRRYCYWIGQFCISIYTSQSVLQQDIQSHELSSCGNLKCYLDCIDSILHWLPIRVNEFETLNPNKKILKINYFEVLEKIRFADELN